MSSQKWMVSCACAAIAMGVMSGPAFAAADQPQGSDASAVASPDESRIAEIIVTARRREESLQSTPIAITAINSEMIERRGVVNMGDLSKIAPNLFIHQTTAVLGSSTTAIRGIGASDNLLGQDSPIGIYIDGVATGRINAAMMDLVEPDSVQVLRGPQGTLFGRNTTGGAIIIQTHTPTDEFSGRVKASYGTYNHRQFSARLDSGLLGQSGIKLTVAYNRRQLDGTQDVLTLPDHKDPGSIESESYFGKIVGEWGNLKATLSGDYSKLSGMPEVLQIIAGIPSLVQYNANSPSYGGGAVPIGLIPNYTYPDFNYFSQTVSAKGAGLTLEYHVAPELTLKAIGGLRSFWRDDPAALGPNLMGPIVQGGIGTFKGFYSNPARRQNQRQRTLELQALGTVSDFDYVLGLYYFNEKAYDFGEVLLPFIISGTLASRVNTFREYTVDSTSKAAFGQVSWKPSFLDKKLELTGGIRYTKDNRTFVQTRANVRTVPLETGNTSYLVSVSYQWTPDLLTYVRYSTGYRAGGFSVRTNPPIDPIFRPEYIKSWEAGFKLDALDRRLRLNVAAFHSKYNDLQVVAFSAVGGGSTAVNANATYKGFEVEATVVPVDGLTLTGSWGYVEPRFDNYPRPLNATGNPLIPGCVAILSSTNTAIAQDCAAVASFRSVPKSNFMVSASYVIPQSYGEWLIAANYAHTSSVPGAEIESGTGFKALLNAPAYGLLSGRIALSKIPLSGENVTAQIAVYGNNLTDKRYFYGGVDFGQFATFGAGLRRTIGVEASVNF